MKNEIASAGQALSSIDADDVPAGLHPLVYFVGTELKCDVPVKIGTTGNLKQRIRALRWSSPAPLVVHAVALGNRHYEAELHHEFRKYRLHGEWFRMTPTLKERIEAFQMIYALNCQTLAERASRLVERSEAA